MPQDITQTTENIKKHKTSNKSQIENMWTEQKQIISGNIQSDY
jgi:hypothetical protein